MWEVPRWGLTWLDLHQRVWPNWDLGNWKPSHPFEHFVSVYVTTFLGTACVVAGHIVPLMVPVASRRAGAMMGFSLSQTMIRWASTVSSFTVGAIEVLESLKNTCKINELPVLFLSGTLSIILLFQCTYKFDLQGQNSESLFRPPTVSNNACLYAMGHPVKKLLHKMFSCHQCTMKWVCNLTFYFSLIFFFILQTFKIYFLYLVSEMKWWFMNSKKRLQ